MGGGGGEALTKSNKLHFSWKYQLVFFVKSEYTEFLKTWPNWGILFQMSVANTNFSEVNLVCLQSNDVFYLIQDHFFLLPKSEICFQNGFHIFLNWETLKTLFCFCNYVFKFNQALKLIFTYMFGKPVNKIIFSYLMSLTMLKIIKLSLILLETFYFILMVS